MPRKIESLFVRYRSRGDLVALGAVFDRVATELLRVANHLTRHPAEAEDVLQETLLTALEKADSYDEARPLTPWLVGILKNHARRLRRRRERASESIENLESGTSAPEPWLEVSWSASLASAVGALDEPYREVLVLRLQHDKSPAEIALLLDRPPATVRSQLHRGLGQLRRKLPAEARPQALAALPLPIGLAAVRNNVLARAGTLVAASALAGGSVSLLVGGILMTQKQLVLAATLLVLALVGGGLWLGGTFESSTGDAPVDAALLDEERDSLDGATPTTELIGTGKAKASNAAAPTVADRGTSAWPPELEIPKDKGSVAGTLRFEDGEPLVGATVALWGSPRVSATTDDQGRFHIHADWVHGRSLFLTLGSEDQPDWLGLILSHDIVMRAGGLVMKDITIKRGMDVKTTVVDAYSGKPLKDVSVTMRHVPHKPGQANSGFAQTDAKGVFFFPYVPRSTYTLAFEREGYEASRHTVDLAADVLPKEYTLTPSRPLLLQFEGLPEGAIGSKISIDLSLIRKPGDNNLFGTSTKAVIQPDGSLTLDAPQPGRYRATLYQSSHLPRMEQEIEIPIGRVDPITLRIAPGARVMGRLRDSAGKVVANTAVSITGGPRGRKTDGSGRFDIPYAKAGTRKLKVKTGGAWVTVGSVDVPDHGEVDVDVTAAGASTIRGRYLIGGHPVDRFEGILHLKDPKTQLIMANLRTDATGVFEVSFLPAGDYLLAAWSSAGLPRTTRITLGKAETKDVGDIDLEPYARVPVKFVLPAGTALPDQISVNAARYSSSLGTYRPVTLDAGNGVRMGLSLYIKPDADGQLWVTGLAKGPKRL
ncbi:MAG: sigma-70 family RNA polymerase sigma factor, partial [bacterium]|nr:sigma-70 family RNA polymerase sigma factor [bacterium]